MLKKIYYYSPTFFQHIIISFYGYYWKNRRYGGNFKKYIVEFKKHESFPKSFWEDYQTKELRKLLIHAFTTVPFYHDLYKRNGFQLIDFLNFKLDDIKKLPYLEKDDLRKFGTTTLLSTKRKKGRFFASSGSTGTPVQLYFSKEFHQKWSALYEVRVRNWAGVNYKMSRAMIGGRRVLTDSQIKPPYFRYNIAEKQAYFSAYHISEETTEAYINELKNMNSAYLVGYAMSCYLLAKNCETKQLIAPKLTAVLTSSEKLTKEMRSVISRVFQCNVFDAYSGIEACGLISENEFGELLVSPEAGLLEILDASQNFVDMGQTGEIISTGFLNYDQPLIRYRIGDYTTLSENQENSSGSNFLKIKSIDGRIEDVIIGESGQQMVRFHGIFVELSGIKMAQIIQHTYSKITIKLVTDAYYNNKSELVMKSRIESQLGNIEIKFEYVNYIERTKNGKFKAVISHIKNG